MAGASNAVEPVDVRIRLLGGFEVVIDGWPVPDRWRLRKAKSLVKLLALADGHRVHREVLAGQLWPELGPVAGLNNLHQVMYVARAAMRASGVDAPLLELRDEVVVLCPGGNLIVDAEVFERAAERAKGSSDVAQLRAALQLWAGELLPEDRYADWAVGARDRLSEYRAGLAVALSAAGEVDEVLPILQSLAAQRPTDERSHRALMTVLAAAGRRWDALAAFEALRDALDRDLATVPSVETSRLYRRLLGTDFARPAVAHNLPVATTSFVGRRRELAELEAILDRARALTLTGPGGAGKTRLALELCRRRAETDRHPDGIWFVGLAGLRDITLVASAVASELGVVLPVGPAAARALADQLADRRALLVLDNCEHLMSGCVTLLGELLAGCPDLTVVATSREALRVPGEVVWRVRSLELPSPGATTGLDRLESVQLFVERARDVVPQFTLDEAVAADVARVCRQLDGIPLALELAAARLAHLSVAALAERLDDAVGTLGQAGHGRLDRQQTLAATLDWSHDLLTDDERVLFRRLAVCAGGFDLEAAEHVSGEPATLDVLSRLIDKSLVQADTAGNIARYRMLEIVRQYAATRLRASGELALCERRHCHWFARGAAAHDPDGGDPVVGEPAAWFDIEDDNLRAALASTLIEEPPQSLLLASSMWRFWMSRGRLAEGAGWLTRALEACPAPSALRARALYGRAVLHARRGETGPLREIGAEIVAVHREIGDTDGLPLAMHEQTTLAFMANDWADAQTLSAQTIAAAADQPAVRASALHLSAVIAMNRGDLDTAVTRLDAADTALTEVSADAAPFFTVISMGFMVSYHDGVPLALGEETVLHGRRVGAAQAAAYLVGARATHARLRGRPDVAADLSRRAYEAFRTLGDGYGQAVAAAQRGHALRDTGDQAAARRCFEEAEGLRRAVRDLRGTALAVAGQALTDAISGHAERARSTAWSALVMMQRSGDASGVGLTTSDLVAVEVLLGDRPAAVPLLESAIRSGTGPAAQRPAGWHHLTRATLLRDLGQHAEADHAVAAARAIFARLGEQRGLAACAER